MIEVQEPSDITLGAEKLTRWKPDATPEEIALYDERLLGAYVYDGCDYDENLRRWKIPRRVIRRGDWGSESYVVGPTETSYFSFTELIVKGEAPLLRTGFPQVAIVTAGEGALRYDGGEMTIKKADELFLPYDVPGLRVTGDVRIVLCNPEGATYELPTR